MIIGNKSKFACEYEIEVTEPILMIKNCLWIQNKFVGNYLDSGTLYAIMRELSRLIEKKGNFFEQEFLDKSPEEIMLIMIPDFHRQEVSFLDLGDVELDRLVKYDKYIFSFGENYDNFVIRIFAINGDYHFLWQLRNPSREFNTCYPNYNRSLQHAIASFSDIENVFKGLQQVFSNNSIG